MHTPGLIEHAMSGVTGAHHPRTSWSHISRYPVLSLDSSDQEKIDAVLWKIHGAIGQCENSEFLALRIKQAAMKELFTRGLRGESQKETEIGPIPSSWALATFAETREWLQYGTSTRCTIDSSGCPVLRIPNIASGKVNTAE